MSVVFVGPRISRAGGRKMSVDSRDEYFDDFLAAACSAAPPGLTEKGIQNSENLGFSITACVPATAITTDNRK